MTGTSPPAVIDFHSDGPSNRTGSIMGGVLNRVGTVVVHIWYYSASKSFGIRTSMSPDLVQLMSREVDFIATGTGIKVVDVLCFLMHYAQVVCRNLPAVCRVYMKRVSSLQARTHSIRSPPFLLVGCLLHVMARHHANIDQPWSITGLGMLFDQKYLLGRSL